MPADTTVPVLIGMSPAANATNVLFGSKIVITFSEPVKARSGNIVLSGSSSSAPYGQSETIPITDGSQVTISGNTVTIDPDVLLISSATYRLEIGPGVIVDMAGNPAPDAVEFFSTAPPAPNLL